ncbi:MAG TPA: cytochrome c oxidase subunit 3 [Pyrinomonadaceae bacterium]|nr:cytochrome c oxidase subunit 3 [Pyrinomonadaceae bacterium]
MVIAVKSGFSKTDTDSRYRIGMWVAIAGVLMLFTSLTSAYIVRAASSNDWQPLSMPRILLLSTALIAVSSGTLEAARRYLKARNETWFFRWLGASILLGTAFLLSQALAWRQLARAGVYLATNPHSSFFYLLTATHGVHLIGGLVALGYLWMRSLKPLGNKRAAAGRQLAADAVTLYWHVMDGLWIYLFLLLFLWR